MPKMRTLRLLIWLSMLAAQSSYAQDRDPDLSAHESALAAYEKGEFATALEHWKLLAEHERYTSQDWQLDGIGVAGIEAVLGMGLVSPDYDVTVVRILASYRF